MLKLILPIVSGACQQVFASTTFIMHGQLWRQALCWPMSTLLEKTCPKRGVCPRPCSKFFIQLDAITNRVMDGRVRHSHCWGVLIIYDVHQPHFMNTNASSISLHSQRSCARCELIMMAMFDVEILLWTIEHANSHLKTSIQRFAHHRLRQAYNTVLYTWRSPWLTKHCI